MNWLEAIWNWLNGNKTIFGVLLLQLGQWLPEGIVWFGFIPVKEAVLWLGGILAGTGILHKIGKATTEPGPNP